MEGHVVFVGVVRDRGWLGALDVAPARVAAPLGALFRARAHLAAAGQRSARDFRSALGLDDDDDDDSPGGGSFDDGSFGGSEGAAPTPAGIDGAIAEEDEGEDASPAK